ncbi:MAG: glycoside hydrolase family 127 protein, partial [Proteobacteria bacterium]|nr:glycoside hydrolase family 127 protein [Pseudomonadota bacterium]
ASNIGETCATVTWLELNAALLALSGEARYAAEIERSMFNQLLAAQDERSGEICYYTALAGRKEFSPGPLCCVSSGPRALSRLPEFAYGIGEGVLAVLQYAPGRAELALGGTRVVLEVATEFPARGAVRLTLTPERPLRFALRLRVPDWAGRFEASLAGHRVAGRAGEFLDLEADWRAGSVVEVAMDLPLAALEGPPTYPGHRLLRRGPQVLALERSLNPQVPYLERTAVAMPPRAVEPLPAPAGWGPGPVYRVPGRARTGARAPLVERACTLAFVPYADARDYRVLLPRAGALAPQPPPVTAYARVALSSAPWRVRPGARALAADRAEAVTDEDPASHCAILSDDPTLTSALGPGARRGEPVWFAVILDEPAAVVRIVFRHGPVAASGGAFDAADGGPWIEIAPERLQGWRDGHYPSPERGPWKRVGRLPGYPAAGEPRPPGGAVYELTLPTAEPIHGLRIVGRPDGDSVSCAELSGFAT